MVIVKKNKLNNNSKAFVGSGQMIQKLKYQVTTWINMSIFF